MRKLITIIIAIISITVGALYIKAMLDFEKEAALYLKNKRNSITKEPKQKEPLEAKSNTAKQLNQETSKQNKDSLLEGSIFHIVFNNPNTPESLKDKPEVVADILYNDLFFELGLTEEEIIEFKHLIIGKRTLDSENHNSDIVDKDEKIKELLGEQSHDVYKEYDETLIQRMRVLQYKQQLGLLDILLLDEQETDLLDLMLQEGMQTQLPYLSGDPQNIEQKIKEIPDDFFEKRAESDKNILEKSRQFLDSEQTGVLEKFLNSASNADEMEIKSLAESYNPENQSEN